MHITWQLKDIFVWRLMSCWNMMRSPIGNNFPELISSIVVIRILVSFTENPTNRKGRILSREWRIAPANGRIWKRTCTTLWYLSLMTYLLLIYYPKQRGVVLFWGSRWIMIWHILQEKTVLVTNKSITETTNSSLNLFFVTKNSVRNFLWWIWICH